jgi:Endonuclease/Exonuclease/phosphatase family 2/C2 domain
MVNCSECGEAMAAGTVSVLHGAAHCERCARNFHLAGAAAGKGGKTGESRDPGDPREPGTGEATEEIDALRAELERCRSDLARVTAEAAELRKEAKKQQRKARRERPTSPREFCSACGTPKKAGARFCWHCGRAVGDSLATAGGAGDMLRDRVSDGDAAAVPLDGGTPLIDNDDAVDDGPRAQLTRSGGAPVAAVTPDEDESSSSMSGDDFVDDSALSSSSATTSSSESEWDPQVGGPGMDSLAVPGQVNAKLAKKRQLQTVESLTAPTDSVIVAGWLRVRHQSEEEQFQNDGKKRSKASISKKRKKRWCVLTDEELIFYSVERDEFLRRGHVQLRVLTLQGDDHQHDTTPTQARGSKKAKFKSKVKGKLRGRGRSGSGGGESPFEPPESRPAKGKSEKKKGKGRESSPTGRKSPKGRREKKKRRSPSPASSGATRNSGVQQSLSVNSGLELMVGGALGSPTSVSLNSPAAIAAAAAAAGCSDKKNHSLLLDVFRTGHERVAQLKFCDDAERHMWIEAIREWSEKAKYLAAIRSHRMEMQGRLAYENISLFVGSWNVGNTQPSEDLSSWIPPNAHDIYVFGGQESTYKDTTLGESAAANAARTTVEEKLAQGATSEEAAAAAETAANSAKSAAPKKVVDASGGSATGASKMGAVHAHDPWFAHLKKHVGEGYYVVSSYWLWQMKLIVLARTKHREKITNVKRDTEATGVAHVAGNKGAVGISFNFHDTSLAFVSSHFAAHQDGTSNRNRNYREVVREIKLGVPSVDITNQFDAIFWMGDLNYRIDLPREEVVSVVEEGNFDRLYDHDQLRKELVAGRVFQGYLEARPTEFAPTYRYLRGTSVYNPEKGRIPAYCDRVLWRTLPGRVSAGALRSNGFLGRLQEPDDDVTVDTRLVSFSAALPVTTSDHKPVAAVFTQRTLVPLYKHFEGRVVRVVLKNLKGSGLYAADARGTSDPYISFFAPFTKRVDKAKTKVKPKTLDPDWSTEEIVLQCTINDAEYLETRHVIFRVMDRDRLSHNDPIGEAALSLADAWGTWKDFELELLHNGTSAGRITGTVSLDVTESR